VGERREDLWKHRVRLSEVLARKETGRNELAEMSLPTNKASNIRSEFATSPTWSKPFDRLRTGPSTPLRTSVG